MKNKNTKSSSIASIVAVTIGLAAQCVHADTNSYQDSELLAQGFLLHVTDHYVADVSGEIPVGTNWVWNEIHVIMTRDLFITNMIVNETNKIPLPTPLAGIPVPIDGYQNANISLWAVDGQGNQGASGYFYTNLLTQGSEIIVNMFPQFPPVFIPLPDGTDPNSLAVTLTGTSGGWGWSYDSVRGGIILQTEQVSTDGEYVVTDNNGDILAHGSLGNLFFAGGDTTTPAASVINPQQVGGVREVDLGANGYNYVSDQKFDSIVFRKGIAVQAKVFDVLDIGNSKLYLSGNINGGTIEVRKWNATGAMEVVPCITTTDSSGNITVITTEYLSKAVVTVLPFATKTTPSPFYLNFGVTY